MRRRFEIKRKRRYGQPLGVSFHPEGPASCRLDTGFQWFFWVLEQMVVPKLHVALHAPYAFQCLHHNVSQV
jgi:hypothetical protein